MLTKQTVFEAFSYTEFIGIHMTNLMCADLHLHTPESDGEVTLEELPSVAKEAGLDAVAVTDHDRVHPGLDEPLEVRENIDVIRGIELRVEPETLNERVDILGYGVEPTSELNSLLDRIQEGRVNRAERMLELIETETGVRPDLEPSTNTGRPHVARAIENHPDLSYTYEEAFDELIGNDGPCYTSRTVPTFEDCIGILRDCCQFLSLAHPYRYDEPIEALKLSQELDGVECVYPYGANMRYEELDWFTTELFELVQTGGSDAHVIDDIGCAALMEEHYHEFLESAELVDYSKFDW